MEIKLNLNEINVILGSLAKQPFEKTAKLIEDLRSQVNSKINVEEELSYSIKYDINLSNDQFEFIISALSKQPYEVVFELVYKMIKSSTPAQ